MTALPVTIADVHRAAAALEGAIARTPTIRAAALSELAGCEVYLELETMQSTGSVKERGALNKLLTLGAAERRAGVVAMSAGNHAQGVAYHARRLGITIVAPRRLAPLSCRRATTWSMRAAPPTRWLASAASSRSTPM